jgi:hypothetical protein
VSHVNLINTLTSIAQHYGVGLDVIRSDPEAEAILREHLRGQNGRADALIRENLLDNTAACMKSDEQRFAKIHTAATCLLKEGNVSASPPAPLTKLNYVQAQQRMHFQNQDQSLGMMEDKDPVDLVLQAAREGTWVLISTVRFPQFWKRLSDSIE